MIKIFSCIKFIALIFLCCVSIKYGHWLLAFFMLFIGGIYCSESNLEELTEYLNGENLQ